jgi:hypothetical protein
MRGIGRASPHAIRDLSRKFNGAISLQCGNDHPRAASLLERAIVASLQ